MLNTLLQGRFSQPERQAEAALWAKLANDKLISIERQSSVFATDSKVNVESSEPSVTIEPEVKSPWYIQFMQSVGAWIASLFILGFTVTFFGLVYDELDTGFAFVIGVIYNLIAIMIYRTNVHSQLFANQLALSINLCGLMSLAYGLTAWFEPNTGVYWHLCVALILFINWLVIEHYSHQVIVSFLLLVCGGAIAYELGWFEFVAPVLCVGYSVIWLNLGKFNRHFAKLHALGYMLAVCLVLVQIPLLMQHSDFERISELATVSSNSNIIAVVSALLIAGVVIYHILKSLEIPLMSKQGGFCLIALALVALLSIEMTGLLTALLILIVGFYVAEKLLFTLGVIGVLSFISWYYYSLQQPLLDKSIWLAALGVVLLLVKWGLTKITHNNEKTV